MGNCKVSVVSSARIASSMDAPAVDESVVNGGETGCTGVSTSVRTNDEDWKSMFSSSDGGGSGVKDGVSVF